MSVKRCHTCLRSSTKGDDKHCKKCRDTATTANPCPEWQPKK